jgi:predicted DNA-binding transcriptional regulator YafY
MMRTMRAPITAARLAEETGVSLRSLYRDIESLRAAGARIDGERGYGYWLTEDYALPPQAFSREEIEAIALGMAEVRHMGDPALAKAAVSVLAKVAATLPNESEQRLFHAISQVYRPDPRYPEIGHINLIRQASWNEEALEIYYQKKEQNISQRTIWPLSIMYTERTLTVLSWCCLREAFRMFRLDRIIEVRPLGTSFRPRRASLLRDYLSLLREGGKVDPPPGRAND